jgi:hypothetical protein
MTTKFYNAEEARAALALGQVSHADIRDSSSAEHFRVACVEARDALPQRDFTDAQLVYGQWLTLNIDALDCDWG